MPIPKRYFKMSHEINNDPEVWELTETFGDRSLRLWIQYLSIFDRNENSFKLSGLWVSQLAKVTKLNLQTVLKATLWMIDREWILVAGEDQITKEWSETARRLAGDWPKNHRRLAGDLPETHRRMVAEWSENGRRVSLCAANYKKYNRTQEQKGNENVPLLSYPTPTPNQSNPSIKKEKKKEEKKEVCTQPVGERTTTEVMKPKSRESWDAYKEAYTNRYGHPPVGHAGVNAMLCRLVDKLGAKNAPLVARYYLAHNGRFYVEKMHPVNLLLNDAEKLHTEWATNTNMTSGTAKNAERRDDAMAQIQRVEAMRGGRS